MNPKFYMLSTLATVWMMIAISCAALPFLYAIPSIAAVGELLPFALALMIGLVIAVPLNIVSRRLCDISPDPRNVWESLTLLGAAYFGIVGWGLPVGVFFTLDEFLRSKSFAILAPNVVIWSVAGAAFGLAMRWFADKRKRSA